MLWGIRRSFDVPWQEIYAAFTDEAAIEDRLTGAGACGVHVVEHDVDTDRLRLRLHATIAVDGTGLALCHRVSAVELDWLTDWNAPSASGGCTATVRIHVSGLPVLIRGTIRLEPAAGRTDVVIDIAASSSSSLLDASTAHRVGEAVASLIEADLAAIQQNAPVVVAA